jgi:hypothetical protein
MNAKTALNKIISLLSKAEVELAIATLKDGTILESPTFDVGEGIEVVSEDGTKSPAPDGEHEISLRDTEGNEVLIKLIVADGKIVERENVELAAADEETIKAEPIPAANGAEPIDQTQLAEDTVTSEEAIPTVGDGVPADITTDGPKAETDLGAMIEKLAYRIEEMEKKFAKMGEVEIEIGGDSEDDTEEEDLPKLDGAPIEAKFSIMRETPKQINKVLSAQENVLSKLYK